MYLTNSYVATIIAGTIQILVNLQDFMHALTGK